MRKGTSLIGLAAVKAEEGVEGAKVQTDSDSLHKAQDIIHLRREVLPIRYILIRDEGEGKNEKEIEKEKARGRERDRRNVPAVSFKEGVEKDSADSAATTVTFRYYHLSRFIQ